MTTLATITLTDTHWKAVLPGYGMSTAAREHVDAWLRAGWHARTRRWADVREGGDPDDTWGLDWLEELPPALQAIIVADVSGPYQGQY